MCFRQRIKSDGSVFPCGRCPQCVARRVSSWSFRLMQEEKVSSSANFVTLTYNNENIPCSLFGTPVLSTDDIQKFFKRLRKAHTEKNQKPIKYYACGEYGGKTHRPHYHIILFNANKEYISQAWGKGSIYNGSVSGASIGYTLKYMCKKRKRPIIYVPQLGYFHKNEFAVMSKGLGLSYLENEQICNWHIADMVNRMYCNIEDGKKVAMPRYFKERLYYENERSAISQAMETKILEKYNEASDKLIGDPKAWIKVINEQKDIDAAYDKMYRSSMKTMI